MHLCKLLHFLYIFLAFSVVIKAACILKLKMQFWGKNLESLQTKVNVNETVINLRTYRQNVVKCNENLQNNIDFTQVKNYNYFKTNKVVLKHTGRRC